MSKNKHVLTATEKEVLECMWSYGQPITAAEIVAQSENRTWKASYIHLVIQSLIKKEMIEIAGFKPTAKNYARTFQPTHSKEQLLLKNILSDYPLTPESTLNLVQYILEHTSDSNTIDSIIALCEKYKDI